MSTLPRRTGKEAFEFTDLFTGRRVLQLTNSTQRSVHGYYDLTPWSPDGRRLVFTRMESPSAAQGDICIVDADGGNLTWLADSRAMSPNDGALAQWSSDGRRIFFRDCRNGESLVGWIELQTGRRGEWPGDLRMVCPTGNRQAWPTEWRHFSYADLLRQRDEMGVFVQDMDTGRSEQVARLTDCVAMHPRRDEIAGLHLFVKHTKWTADGKRLLFVLAAAGPNGEEATGLGVKDLYVVNSDGSGLRRVGDFGHHPIWHPNGRDILANCRFGDHPGLRLVLINADTGERRLATEAMPGSGHPSYSPDGCRILLDRVRRQHGGLYLVDLEANAVERLLQIRLRDHSHQGTHLHPVWSRDGRHILFACDVSGASQLCVLDV